MCAGAAATLGPGAGGAGGWTPVPSGATSARGCGPLAGAGADAGGANKRAISEAPRWDGGSEVAANFGASREPVAEENSVGDGNDPANPRDRGGENDATICNPWSGRYDNGDRVP